MSLADNPLSQFPGDRRAGLNWRRRAVGATLTVGLLVLFAGCEAGLQAPQEAQSNSQKSGNQPSQAPKILLRQNFAQRRAGTFETLVFEIVEDSRYFEFRIVDADKLLFATVDYDDFGDFDIWWTMPGKAKLTVEALLDGEVAAAGEFAFNILPATTFLGAELANKTRFALYLPGRPVPAERQRLQAALELSMKSLNAGDLFNIGLAGDGREVLEVSPWQSDNDCMLAATAQNLANGCAWLAEHLPGHEAEQPSLYEFVRREVQLDSSSLDTMILIVGEYCQLDEFGNRELAPNETHFGNSTPLEDDFGGWWCKFDHARLQVVYLGHHPEVLKVLRAVAELSGGRVIQPD